MSAESAIAGGLTSGLMNIAGGLISNYQNYKNQSKLNQQQADLSYQNQSKMLDESLRKEDAYNRRYQQDYASLIRRSAENAGINPLTLLKGGSGMASAGNAPSGQTGAGASSSGSPSLDLSHVGSDTLSAANQAADIELKQSQAKLNEVDAENKGANTDLTKKQIEQVAANIQKMDAETKHELLKMGLTESQINLTQKQIETEAAKPALLSAQQKAELAKAWNLEASDLDRMLGKNPTNGDYVSMVMNYATKLGPVGIGAATALMMSGKTDAFIQFMKKQSFAAVMRGRKDYVDYKIKASNFKNSKSNFKNSN